MCMIFGIGGNTFARYISAIFDILFLITKTFYLHQKNRSDYFSESESEIVMILESVFSNTWTGGSGS